MNKNSKWILSPKLMGWTSLVLSVPFLLLALAGWFRWSWLEVLDVRLGLAITQQRVEPLTSFFRIATELGGVVVSVIVILLVCLYLQFKVGRRELAIWYALTVSLGAGALNQLAKFIFQRPRPLIEHLVHQGGYSFPSGHSMGSIILYGAFVFVVVQLTASRTVKWISFVAALVIVLVVGISRIYLGVHFPSDVIGGFSLGAAWLVGCIGLYQAGESRRS